MLPDLERADRIGEFWGYPESRAFAEEKGFPRVRLPTTAAAACGASERSRRGQSAGGAFSPDGATVVYTIEPNVRGGHTQLWTVASDGSREPKLVLEGYGALYESTYSSDGTRIAFFDGGDHNTHRLRIVNSDGATISRRSTPNR
jgi:hypothetical protein